MNTNKVLKILCSLPIILIFLYFIPFIGICLILLRAFIYKNQSKIKTPITLVVIGIIILIPKILYFIFDIIKVDINNIPYLKDILNSEIYINDLIGYSKYLISAGIILLIISYIVQLIYDKVSNKINKGFQSYIQESVNRDAEISKENDLKIKIKQEKAKNTGYVKCPTCGSDNLVSEKFGTCKYCRNKLVNKDYNKR